MLEETITGLMDVEGNNILFTVPKNGFRFCFVNDSVLPLEDQHKPFSFENRDGYIYGRTHDNRRLAIYVDDENLNVYSTQNVNVGAYILSERGVEFDSFKSISFVGGTLNRVFHPERLSWQHPSEVTIKDDHQSFTIKLQDSIITVDLESSVSLENTHEGVFVRNSDVSLTLSFASPQPLREIFRHYYVLKRVLAFMCFRKNVGFERIKLIEDTESYTELGSVYICDERNLTNKDWQKNIGVRDLEDSFPKLIELFYDDNPKSKQPIIDFLPDNDSDYGVITRNRIKEICTSIELECKLDKMLKCKERRELEGIIEIVLRDLRDYKSENPLFDDSSYNSLCNSVKNWSISFQDKMTALYEKYKKEISEMNVSRVEINSDTIRDLVRFRNGSTHGRTDVFKPEIIETAFYMQAVVYICVLKRIGVAKDRIDSFIKLKLLK